MSWILDNWHIILIGVIVIVFGVLYSVRFSKLSKDEQYAKIRGWLLQAVIWAEKEYGGGTGKVKLSEVYALFCEAMPWLAKMISFDLFSEYVDDALEEMKHLLNTNAAIAGIVEGEMDNEMICGPNGCDINFAEIEANDKISAWLRRIEQMDYDAPRSTTREQEF